MSCHCSVEVSTGCTGAAGPFLLGGTYTGRLYSRVATLVCLDFAFLVFSVIVFLCVFFGRHSPTSASGTQASQFVCRCNVIPEVQWVVPVTDSFFLEITVVKYKSGEFSCCCQNPQVSVFFSPVVCLLERYHVVTRMSLRLSALIHVTSQSLWLSQSNALPTLPVQHVSVLASPPPPIPDDKNTISWLTETNL